MLFVALATTLLLALQVHAQPEEVECKAATLQELRDLKAASTRNLYIFAIEDGFQVTTEIGECYQAHYDSLSDDDKAIYDESVAWAREQWAREYPDDDTTNLDSAPSPNPAYTLTRPGLSIEAHAVLELGGRPERI